MDVKAALVSLARTRPDRWVVDGAGVTRSEAVIPALVDRGAHDPEAGVRVLLIGGLSGEARDVEIALQVLEHLAGRVDQAAGGPALSAVPCGNPDGLRLGVGPENGAGGIPSTGYPPAEGFFDDPKDPETRYLWRWVSFHAPDVVLELRAHDGSPTWEVNEVAEGLAPGLGAKGLRDGDSLLGALGREAPDALGLVPGVRLTVAPSEAAEEVDRLWDLVVGPPLLERSPAREVIEGRAARSRLEVCHDLASAHGRTLEPVRYTQGIAISGRLRMALLESTDIPTDIVPLVEPFAADPKLAVHNPSLTTGLGGLVWGDELTEATGDPRYAGLVIKAADCYQPRGKGEAPPPAKPDFQVEDMLFAGILLGRAFSITGNADYANTVADLLVSCKTQQADGLFWHSRNAPHYWGRGNGFAAMGLTEALTFLPQNQPERKTMESMIARQMEAVRDHQTPSGMVRQVVDFPGAYSEFTATCMIGYSITRGIRRGWLDGSLKTVVDRAWRAASERIDERGNVVDACVGTGGNPTVRDYLDRPASSGFDDRSGSMALWFGTEMERLAREGG